MKVKPAKRTFDSFPIASLPLCAFSPWWFMFDIRNVSETEKLSHLHVVPVLYFVENYGKKSPLQVVPKDLRTISNGQTFIFMCQRQKFIVCHNVT